MSEETMVERVAKAIASVDYIADWQDWLPEARAAIEAMREPSAWMVTVGSNIPVVAWNGKGSTFADDPTPIYAAMIDAALEC